MINKRKLEHLNVVLQRPEVDRKKGYFSSIHLCHRALPEVDLAAVDPAIEFMGKRLSFPLLISPMTGGNDEVLVRVNKNLALAAEKCGVAMGVGSQRVLFGEPQARSSFSLREFAPNALLFGNLGAVQLNYGVTLAMCEEAVAVLKADALCLHLNPLQETVQLGGNTNFSGLAKKIGSVARNLSVPVIVKEVGCGLDPQSVELLAAEGVSYFDVAGAGGTSWSLVENCRQERSMVEDVFSDWGIPTPLALQALAGLRDRVTLVASGGVRSGLDMAKAVVLGASLCGMAGPFLAAALESAEAVVAKIELLRRDFVLAMFLLGVTRVEQFQGRTELILT